jgi:hypothetical protein
MPEQTYLSTSLFRASSVEQAPSINALESVDVLRAVTWDNEQ